MEPETTDVIICSSSSDKVLVVVTAILGAGILAGGREGIAKGRSSTRPRRASILDADNVIILIFFDVPGIGGSSRKRVDEANAKETKEIDDGSHQAKQSSYLREGEYVKRSRVADLFPPPVEEKIGNGEEKREKESISEVEGERGRIIGGLERRKMMDIAEGVENFAGGFLTD